MNGIVLRPQCLSAQFIISYNPGALQVESLRITDQTSLGEKYNEFGCCGKLMKVSTDLVISAFESQLRSFVENYFSK